MLPNAIDLLKWVVFTDEERTVLLEAFTAFFPVPEPAPTTGPKDEAEGYSARLDLQTDKIKLKSLQSIRSDLISSLHNGSNAVIGFAAIDCEALNALVTLEIIGFYNYQMSLEDSMTSLGIEFIQTDDARQKARLRIVHKLNT